MQGTLLVGLDPPNVTNTGMDPGSLYVYSLTNRYPVHVTIGKGQNIVCVRRENRRSGLSSITNHLVIG